MKSKSPLFIQIEPLDAKQLQYRWWLELAWIGLTLALIAVLIYQYLPELRSHSFFMPIISGLLTIGLLGRYVLSMRVLPWSRHILTLLALCVLCIPIGIYLFTEFTEFQVYFDDHGFEDLFNGRSFEESISLKRSLRKLCVFAFVGGLASVLIFPASTAVYLWRIYKKQEGSRK